MTGISTYYPNTTATYTLGRDYFLGGFIPAGDARLYEAQLMLDQLLAIPAVAAGKLKYLSMAGPNEDASLLNWIDPSVGLARKSGNLTFTADKGFVSDGTGLVSTGASMAGLGITRNSALLGCYQRVNGGVGTTTVDVALGGNSFIVARGTTRVRLCADTTVDWAYTAGDPTLGFWVARRENASQVYAIRPGRDWTTFDQASAPSDGELTAFGSAAAGNLRSSSGLSAWFAGTYMTASEWAPIQTWITRWLALHGAL